MNGRVGRENIDQVALVHERSPSTVVRGADKLFLEFDPVCRIVEALPRYHPAVPESPADIGHGILHEVAAVPEGVLPIQISPDAEPVAEAEEVIVVDFDRRRAVAVDIEVRTDRPFVFRQDVHIYDRGIIRTRNGEDIDIGNVIARPQQAAVVAYFHRIERIARMEQQVVANLLLPGRIVHGIESPVYPPVASLENIVAVDVYLSDRASGKTGHVVVLAPERTLFFFRVARTGLDRVVNKRGETSRAFLVFLLLSVRQLLEFAFLPFTVERIFLPVGIHRKPLGDAKHRQNNGQDYVKA
jgi:hypothetical protein